MNNFKIYKDKGTSMTHDNNDLRYIIIEESFGYTIVDTKIGKEIIGTYIGWKKVMCETFDKEIAIEICNALNLTYEQV